MKNFMSEAKNLASNPLGIIALFISMIYGFACLVVGMKGNIIDPKLAYPLIWFLVGFPVMILLSFLFLVVKHHEKLYAPKDFRDEENFFKRINGERQNERLDNEIAEIGYDNIENSKHNGEELEREDGEESEGESNVIIDDKVVNNVTNSKTRDISLLNLNYSYNQVKKDYMLVEELAIRKLEDEYNVKIYRQIQIPFKKAVIEVDGLCKIKNRYLLFEVKYTKNNKLPNSSIHKIEYMADILSNEREFRAKLVIVVVHNYGFGETLRKQLYERFKDNKVIEFKFYNNSKLQKDFIS